MPATLHPRPRSGPRYVQWVDVNAVVRVGAVVSDFGVDQPPGCFVWIPDLRHFVVKVEARGEVGGEPNASTGLYAEMPCERHEEHREVATATEQTRLRGALVAQRTMVELEQAAQHRLCVSAVDLCEPLVGDAEGRGVVGPVVEYQAPHDPLEGRKVARHVGEVALHLAGVGDGALVAVERTSSHLAHPGHRIDILTRMMSRVMTDRLETSPAERATSQPWAEPGCIDQRGLETNAQIVRIRGA